MERPLVAIVLVNWNATEDTIECLRSLSRVEYSRFFVVVVDNGSKQDPTAEITATARDVSVLRLGRNCGFAGGNNVGMAHALQRGADYVLCLNNDTLVAPDFVDLLVDAVEPETSIGMATPAIYRHSQPTELVALGCDIDLCASPPAWQIVPRERPRTDAHEVPFGEGCALMLRRVVVEKTGGFDEHFFAYAEDADLCLRARRFGWRCVVVPAARVWHKIDRVSSGHHSDAALFYFFRNVWHLIRRHATARQRQLFVESHARLIRAELVRFLKAGLCSSCKASNQRAQNQFLAILVGTVAGLFGWSGDRRRWAVLEGAIRLMLTPLIKLAGSAFPPVYRKMRQKAAHPASPTACA